jgi:hypothetical protein
MPQETLSPGRVWSVCRKPDRRSQRIRVPPCETCGETRVAVASRTDCVVYLRCPDCCHVWSVPKPGLDLSVASQQPPGQGVAPANVDRAVIDRGESCQSF